MLLRPVAMEPHVPRAVARTSPRVSEPRITVVTAVRDGEEFVEAAVQSVLDQTLPRPTTDCRGRRVDRWNVGNPRPPRTGRRTGRSSGQRRGARDLRVRWRMHSTASRRNTLPASMPTISQWLTELSSMSGISTTTLRLGCSGPRASPSTRAAIATCGRFQHPHRSGERNRRQEDRGSRSKCFTWPAVDGRSASRRYLGDGQFQRDAA